MLAAVNVGNEARALERLLDDVFAAKVQHQTKRVRVAVSESNGQNSPLSMSAMRPTPSSASSMTSSTCRLARTTRPSTSCHHRCTCNGAHAVVASCGERQGNGRMASVRWAGVNHTGLSACAAAECMPQCAHHLGRLRLRPRCRTQPPQSPPRSSQSRRIATATDTLAPLTPTRAHAPPPPLQQQQQQRPPGSARPPRHVNYPQLHIAHV
jgi:hypothetical protein